ncbi:Eukaryotic translation initiation factor 3 subunit G [Ophiophagus hannah]|uniref:Eukaryotic translation initiation factor 3 subunit G n=1 Tax=Ophiophagus hannah TaxID=8665 RepID=V8NS67_OPHHA|nr:Eukaryotic translation initiation factor 3 subunit G [Ophiophagus hannah]
MPTGDYEEFCAHITAGLPIFSTTDKCITSDLLKDIPLTEVLSGNGGVSVTIEPELVKGEPLPPPKEVVNGNIKTVTEYREEEDGRKVKIIRTFRIETRKASKAVARRKNWKKFGNSEFDAPGPNVATTTVSDDVFMTFITSKEDLNCTEEEDPMNKLKGQKIVSCRICKGDHWTTRCPYKDTLGPMQKELAEQLGLSTGEKEKLPGEPEPAQAQQNKTGKYVPPSLRDGASRRGESMQPNRRADDNATIRVTNLSEDTRETDLQELFRPFGSISRIYLAKDKTTGQSKGFAFISFHRREDAARAIAGVSGFGYDHLILNVEWANSFCCCNLLQQHLGMFLARAA